MRKTTEICGCGFELPVAARFCPNCGGNLKPAPKPAVNAAAFEALLGPAIEQTDELEWKPTNHSKVAWAVAALAVFATIGAGIFFVTDYQRRADAAEAALAREAIERPVEAEEPEPEQARQVVLIEASDIEIVQSKKLTTLIAGKDALITLYDHRGSRYATLDERAHAVQLRLKHVVETSHAKATTAETSRFHARRNADVYEVVWQRADGHAFRVVDVTKRDVRAWKKKHGATSRSILANAIADQLNASLYGNRSPQS